MVVNIKSIETGFLVTVGEAVRAFHHGEEGLMATYIFKLFHIRGLRVVDEKKAARIQVYGEKNI